LRENIVNPGFRVTMFDFDNIRRCTHYEY
jgi:hypothetical protein